MKRSMNYRGEINTSSFDEDFPLGSILNSSCGIDSGKTEHLSGTHVICWLQELCLKKRNRPSTFHDILKA
jgi:hypothetical protein